MNNQSQSILCHICRSNQATCRCSQCGRLICSNCQSGIICTLCEQSNKTQQDKMRIAQQKTIRETRCTCITCGHVWHYGALEVLNDVGNSLSDAGTAMTCPCCCFTSFVPSKPKQAPSKCPKCNSGNVTKERVTYFVDP